MKTFEERYTAWIDGQLAGPALTAFELELSRRAAAGEARADKRDAEQLRDLLKTGLRAPVLTNTDFFNHQLRERIAADRASGQRREQPSPAWSGLFAWSFGRLTGLGAACLFCAAALYYGLMPGGESAYKAGTPKNAAFAKADARVVNNVEPAGVGPSGLAPAKRDPSQPLEVVSISPTPAPVDLAPKDIEKVQVADQSKDTTTATPLHYQKPDVNVIWINGLDYLPNVPEETSPAPASAPSAPSPATAATAQP